MAVYFIRSPHGVKVGFSDNVPGRLKQLQTGSAFELELEAVIPAGTRRTEAALHDALAAERQAGEWFAGKCTEKAVRMVRDGWRPTIPEHVDGFVIVQRLPREDRVKARPLPIIPHKLRGTRLESTIMNLDAFIRRNAHRPDDIGCAFKALRRAQHGNTVDTSEIPGYGEFESELTASGDTQSRLDPE